MPGPGGYVGSPNIFVSTANQELVTKHPTWSYPYAFREFSFLNYADCHVKINGSSDPIFLKAEQGFSMSLGLIPVKSFIVVESGIECQFIGAY
ncbi:hypothetical protein ACH6EH_06600 [Paenibacillus sp. JSM ZJ436]|uniref:hypothetical protein n=1 Tax=Paenibacillus sp. JSM ZJ436 TaxID=3376190 RepID=UPI00378839E3